MVSRVDALLGELKARHGTDPGFMERLRPMVESIFDGEISDEVRPHLLELLAETCDRQVRITQNSEEMRAAFAKFFGTITDLLGKLAIERAGDMPFTDPRWKDKGSGGGSSQN